MNVSRALVLVVASAALTVPSAVHADPPTPGTFRGLDGQDHPSAPVVVPGLDDQLFYGPDLDVACGLGDKLETQLLALSRLAKAIERSGRKVVFTVAPSKSSVLTDQLDVPNLPHGSCDQEGVEEQNTVLDDYTDPAYLPMRSKLAEQQRQVYYRTDLHWTTVGGSIFTKALAYRLDPRLGRRQHYRHGTESRLGQLEKAQFLDTPEVVPTASPADHVQVRTAKGTPAWSGYPDFTFYDSWVSSPASRTWPGNTLVLGDSFAWFALENLRPMFRRGQFMWFVHRRSEAVRAGIKWADTVVIEVYQTVLPGCPMLTPAFRHQIKRLLGVHHR